MRYIRPIGWLALGFATLAAWRSSPARIEGPPPGVAIVRDLAATASDGRLTYLDLMLPDKADGGPWPIVVALHGGSWTGGARRDYAGQFAGLVRAGHAVAVLDYRLARPGAPSWDGALRDVSAAIDRLVVSSAEHRLDPERIAAVGTSSGGLLVALAALEDRRIGAAVCLSTPTDLIALASERRLKHEPAIFLIGEVPTRQSLAARKASPLHQATPSCPPLLLIHGDDDRWVDLAQARNLHRCLNILQVKSQLIELPGSRHGFDLQIGGTQPRDLTTDVIQFLAEAWARKTAESTSSVTVK